LVDVNSYFSSRLTADPKRAVLWKSLWNSYFRFQISEEDTVVDLGAGYCDFINVVRARKRIAIDRWPGSREHAADGVEVHTGDITDLSWLPDSSVDFALASNVFEHLPQADLAQVLSQLRTKFSARGRLCVIQPNYRYCAKEYFDDYTHVSVFSHVSLSDFLRANDYSIVDCKPRFLPLTIKSRFPVHPALVRAYLALPFKPFGKQMLLVASPVRADRD
jgi:hypothetical protein